MAHSRESGEGRGCTGAESARESRSRRAGRGQATRRGGYARATMLLARFALIYCCTPAPRPEESSCRRRKPGDRLRSFTPAPDVVPSHCSTRLRRSHPARALPPPAATRAQTTCMAAASCSSGASKHPPCCPTRNFRPCGRSPRPRVRRVFMALLRSGLPQPYYVDYLSGREAARAAASTSIGTLRSPDQRPLHRTGNGAASKLATQAWWPPATRPRVKHCQGLVSTYAATDAQHLDDHVDNRADAPERHQSPANRLVHLPPPPRYHE